MQVHEINSAFIGFDELSDKDYNWQKPANRSVLVARREVNNDRGGGRERGEGASGDRSTLFTVSSHHFFSAPSFILAEILLHSRIPSPLYTQYLLMTASRPRTFGCTPQERCLRILYIFFVVVGEGVWTGLHCLSACLSPFRGGHPILAAHEVREGQDICCNEKRKFHGDHP